MNSMKGASVAPFSLSKKSPQEYYKSEEQLNILLGRANDEIAKLQIEIDKNMMI